MPSGAKKRKAAKKKKEQEAQNSSQGHDDAKSQDDRGSDGGEIGSPASQDSQNHQDPFSVDAEENGKNDIPSVHITDAESITVEEIKKDEVTTEILGNEDGVDNRIEKDMEPEDQTGGRSDKIVYADDARRSTTSSSSSDDESRLSGKNLEEEVHGAALYNAENKVGYSMSGNVVPVTETAALPESDYFSAVETAFNNDLVEPEVDSFNYGKVVRITENASLLESDYFSAVETAFNNDLVEPEVDSSNSGKVVRITENASLLESDYLSAVETAPSGDLVKPVFSMSEEVVRATKDSPLTDAVVSDMVQSVRKENEEKLLPESSLSTGTKLEGTKNPISDALAPETIEIAKEAKETEIPDANEKQPVVSVAPSVGGRTSFFSCCGLFDVFASFSK